MQRYCSVPNILLEVVPWHTRLSNTAQLSDISLYYILLRHLCLIIFQNLAIEFFTGYTLCHTIQCNTIQDSKVQ